MIGLRGITRRRTDAAIFLRDQIFNAEFLVLTVAPVGARALVQVFGESFSQSIGERLGHNRVVLVVVLFETPGQLLATVARRNGKRADIIDPAALTRRDIVGERQLRLAALIWLLLAQRVQTRQRFRARHIAVNDDIVVVAVRRKKTVDAMSGE